jgi:2-oxoglutarate dehydrogenase E2 component (dihydrolipoamide succinyltransferase)
MSIELKIPDVGESIREVQIGRWLKREGDTVAQDENVVELETDKASMELPAPSAGVLSKILKREGEMVAVGDVIGYLDSDGVPDKKDAPSGERRAKERKSAEHDGAKAAPASPSKEVADESKSREHGEIPVTPAARRALRDHGLAAADIEANGPRIEREDVLRHVKERAEDAPAATESAKPASRESAPEGAARKINKPPDQRADEEIEEIVPMSLIRRRIAERLVQAQQQSALLTTFNEIDMTAVQELRSAYREAFQKKYGIKLGFMSFFVKAVVDALRENPALNAEIRDRQVIYRRYHHIGIAIGSKKGLVVPVLRHAERLSFAEIEQAIDDFARRAANNKLEAHELEGGTFTITNGGIYGSLLSTPIVNPPQSGVLGMHAIQDRPIARDGQVVVRPMMYVALTYDHRLVDGREAVTFLTRVKDTIEEPSRMLLEV